MTVRDSELLELLRDEPELLALADAVASTPPPQRRHGRAWRRAGAAVALAAALALAVTTPWQRGGGRGVGIVDRALAAVGRGPVTHAVVKVSDGVRIRLETGKRAPASTKIETWSDEQAVPSRP